MSPRRHVHAIAIVVVAGAVAGVVTGCARPVPVASPDAPSASTTATASGSAARTAKRQGDVITEDEIRGTPATNVYQLLEMARPQFLRPVPGASPRSGQKRLPYIYVNGMRWGPLESLRTMQPTEVISITRISVSMAQLRYGGDNAGGVLDVITRTAR